MLKISDLQMLGNIDCIFRNRIILYGAGDLGMRSLKLLKQLKIFVYGICDTDQNLWGKTISGYRILSIQQLSEACTKQCSTIILSMANPEYVEQVLRILDDYKISNVECYTYFALKTAVELHIEDKRIAEAYRKDFYIARKAFYDYLLNDWENRARKFIYSSMLHDTIAVLQPGKVGSTSIAKSLDKEKIHYSHLHSLAFGNWLDPNIKNSYGIWHQWQKSPIKKLESIHQSEKVKVISLVRDPIGRSIADYFEGLGSEYMKYESNENFDIYQEVNEFIRKEAKVGEYGYIFEWFNQEIKNFFGIDIYQYGFDRKKGYFIICEGNVEILLIKMERINDCQEILGQFVGVDNFELEKENIGDRKLYKFVYEEVKRTIQIPKDILDFYYKGNKAMDHFYTETEKKEFKRKWSK